MKFPVAEATLTCALALAAPARAEEMFFGYVGIACDHDDPFDAAATVDYADEVAGWTNAAHVCLPADPAQWAARLAEVDRRFRPILSVEPAFDLEGAGPDSPGARAAWAAVVQAVRDSGIDPARLILHVADEPALRGIDPARVSAALRMVRADLPQAETLVVEVCRGEGPPPIPPETTLWGFDCYTIRDPGADWAFRAFMNAALWSLDDGQRLVLVMDATHTPYHQAAGLSPEDMGQVALAYGRLALDTPGVAGMIGYAWPGGIDGHEERGARNLPPAAIAAHHEVGRMLLGAD